MSDSPLGPPPQGGSVEERLGRLEAEVSLVVREVSKLSSCIFHLRNNEVPHLRGAFEVVEQRLKALERGAKSMDRRLWFLTFLVAAGLPEGVQGALKLLGLLGG